MIAEALDGKRLFVTGSTGFLGTALVERLLRSVPGCQLVLLVRPGRRSTAQRRVEREILKNDAFDRLRQEHGADFAAWALARVTVVDGDVGTDGLGLDDEGRAALQACDVVIHSAATVAFDSPLDSAVEVNLLGPMRIAKALQAVGGRAHLVAVSTCYVAGNRRGDARELPLDDQPFSSSVRWRPEVDAARRRRADVEAESRTPARLAAFAKRARAELGAAGTPLLAEKAERIRDDWVAERMVEAGRSRARSLGWPDAYAYTKALGEQALLEARGDVPVTIVRPSIIESAHLEPRPGWIRGFRMAEPVIISYARGLLKEFPGIPEGVVDVIPVDHVVAAVIDAAARGPEPEPVVVQVASSVANPLGYRKLVDMVQQFFGEHPVYDAKGQPILVPEWSFPGRGKVQGQLERASRVINKAEKALSALPLRGAQARWSETLEDKKADVERALTYVELYGAYAETEALFHVDRLLDRYASLDDDDKRTFCFDPRVVDWEQYALTVHLPSVVEHSRVRTTSGGNRSEKREDRLRRQVLAPERHFAAFDLENTLIASNVVESYGFLASRRLAPHDRARFVARILAEGPSLLKLDRKDRGDFLRSFYRRYEGAPVRQLDEDAEQLLSYLIVAKSFPAGFRRVRQHRALGHRTVLITGALDIVVEKALAPLFDEIVCARMSVRPPTPEHPDPGGTYTGELTSAPPTGEARALAMQDYADAEGLSMDEAIAYADSASDLPMLEAVGFPVAVNPETRLAAIARKRGWLVEHWEKAPGGPRPLLPLGPQTRRTSFRRPGVAR